MALCSTGYSQSPVYSFTVTTDTVIEHNAILVVGYVKADTAPAVDDSVVLVLQAGMHHSSHVDTTSSFVMRFIAGQDSIPFTIYIVDDTIPEFTETLTYILRNYGSNAGIGSDSVFNFVLKDNDLPATIGYVVDSITAWEHDAQVPVTLRVNNPNPFYIRYETDFYDLYTIDPRHQSNCVEAFDFYYNPEIFYAPPGISTQTKMAYLVDNNVVNPDKVFYCHVYNLDANIIVDSFVKFTIQDDDYNYPPTVSFDTNRIEIRRDTTQRVSIPITINNPNWRTLSFFADTVWGLSPFNHTVISSGNSYFSKWHGIWKDTIVVYLTNDHWVQDTQTAVFKFKGILNNTSPDTLFYLVLTSPDSLYISFKGAAKSHLKSDSIGYVNVYTSGAVKYNVTADVKYLNGNATPGVDFIFRDTSILFRANLFDTAALPVIMLKDHLHQGNEQVNLQLLNVSPASITPLIIQYTYMIIDDDSTAIWAGIEALGDVAKIKIYPNPFVDAINLQTELANYVVTLTNVMGEVVHFQTSLSGTSSIPTAHLPKGIYVLTITAEGHSVSKKIVK